MKGAKYKITEALVTLRGKLVLQYGKDPFDCGTGRVQRRQDLHHPVHAAPRGPVAVMEVEDTLIVVFVTTAEKELVCCCRSIWNPGVLTLTAEAKRFVFLTFA